MRIEYGFSNLIYEYFVIRLRLGYYTYGDTLPSIDTLCRQFSVARQTVQTALCRLKEEGYVEIHHGRTSKVIFKQSTEELNTEIDRFFSGRQAAFPDLYQSTELIFIPLLCEGFQCMNEEDFVYIADLAERADADDLIRFYCFVLQKAGNPLVMNLFWETSLFLGLPFIRENQDSSLYDVALIRDRLKLLVINAKTRDYGQIRKSHLAFQKDIIKELTGSIDRHFQIASQEEPIPFKWRVYRERPQVCYSLAVRILHEMYMGEYQDKSFLPSYGKMAKKYGVSVSTIRRTISILNQIGAARSVNGKGTEIFSLRQPGSGQDPDFSAPAVRRNLAYFIQAFHMITCSCEEVTRVVLSLITKEEREELTNMLEEYLFTGRCIISSQSFFAFLAVHSPLQGIQEIYGKLYGLLLWGYPMKVFRKEPTDLDLQLIKFTKRMVDHLKSNDINGCAGLVKKFMDQTYFVAKAGLLNHDFQPEELSLSPSFKLLPSEK